MIEGIRPKYLVFLSIIQRTKISCPNQVSVQNFRHKMKRFNRSIKDILASYPWASSFSEAKFNFPKYLKDDGCHPNSQGMSRYISIIHSLDYQI